MLGLTKDAMDAAIRVVLFSGKSKDWLAWMEKFLEKAKQKNLKHIYLLDLTKNPILTASELAALYPNKDADKFKIALAKLNEDAYSELIMSIDTNTMAGMIAFHIVASTKTADYPDGHAPKNAWTRLKAKFQPDTRAKLTQITTEFYAMDMKGGQDPEIFITKLEYHQYRMEELGSNITDDQFKMHIINNLPSEYDVAVNLLTRKITTVTIEELRADLRYEYDRIKTRKMLGITIKVTTKIPQKNMRYLQVGSLKGSVIIVDRLDTEQMHVGSKIQVRNQMEVAVEAVANSSKMTPVEAGIIKVVVEAKMDGVAGDLVVPVTIVRRSAIVSKIVIRRKEMKVAKQQQQLLVTITTNIIVEITGIIIIPEIIIIII
jgi:gag-polypeptide of LTR copia-type